MRFWFDLRVEGLEHIPASGPAIVACNHLSYLDPLTNANAVMKAGRRPRFLAKRDLFEIPVVGSAFRGATQIPVQRGTRDTTPAAAGARRRSPRRGGRDLPEGTVTKRDDHLPMEGKTGTVRLSLASRRADHAARELGLAGRVAEVRAGQPEVRPAGVDDGRASRSTSRPRRGEADDHDAVKAMTAELMDALTEMVGGPARRYPERWSHDG